MTLFDITYLNFGTKTSLNILSATLLTVIVTAITGCAPELGDSDAALLLEDIMAGEEDSRLKASTPSPSRRQIEYSIDGRDNAADLYLSPEGTLAGIVMIPGMVKKGKDDHRLVALANTLARLRFAVLVPEVAGLRRLYTRASDVRTMADAFRYLDEHPELPANIKTGFGGFSYGAGIVLLSSLELDIRNKVDFIMGFGGYYDMTNIVTYFTTGYYRDEKSGKLIYRRPHYYLKQVFTISNSALLESSDDRDRLRALLENDDEDLYQELDKLSPDALALYNLITNENPQKVNGLLEKLPSSIKKELQTINPANKDLSQIKAQVILLHGRGDTMIPFTESIAIASALPVEKTTLFLIEGYAHTDVRPKPQDLPQLLGAMELLMQQRTTKKLNSKI